MKISAGPDLVSADLTRRKAALATDKGIDMDYRHSLEQMPTDFDNIMQQVVSPAIDEHLGEFVTFHHCLTRPNFQAEIDPTKPPWTIRAVFRNRSKLALRESGPNHFVGVTSREPELDCDALLLEGRGLRQGDRVYRERRGDWYEIRDMRPDGVSRVRMPLTQLGVPSATL